MQKSKFKFIRDEGISWGIREIIKMGEKVFDVYLPDFLD